MNKTVLHQVAEKGDHKLFTFLLNYLPKDELNLIINKVDDNGNTALHLAACSLSVQPANQHVAIHDMIKLLLNKGADPRVKNLQNVTPANFLPKTKIVCTF